MKMLFVGIFAACIAMPSTAVAQSTSATPVAPTDPASLALARQVLAAEFPPEKREQMFSKRMDSIWAQSRTALEKFGKPGDKRFQSILDEFTLHFSQAMKTAIVAGLPDIYEGEARALSRNLSSDDLRAILVFVRSPAGEHYFQALPSLSSDPDVIAATQRTMARLMNNANEIVQQGRKAAEDYATAKAKSVKDVAHKPAA